MTTVKKYLKAIEAELDKTLLEQAGIPAFIADEGSTTTGYGSILEGVRLQVQDSDADRARRIIETREGATPLPDNFVPPVEQPPYAQPASSNAKDVILAVTVTLLISLAGFMAFNSYKTSSSSVASQRARQQYEERAKRYEAQLATAEAHQKRTEVMLQKQEEQQARLERILATWERQQEQYQKYLDGLEKKP